MKRIPFASLSTMASLLFANACTDSGAQETAGGTGTPSSSSTSASSAGGTGGGGDGGGGSGGAGRGTGGGAVACGGFDAVQCGPDEYCDTGAEPQCIGEGVCKPRPTDCSPDCPGACGCDLTFYCNECEAHAHGTGIGQNICLSPQCVDAGTALATKFDDEACSTVVRLDYATLAVLGYRVVCGPELPLLVDEATARASAQRATGFGATGALLTEPQLMGDYVFYEAPAPSGGVSVVNATDGLAELGASIGSGAAPGSIGFPSSWDPTADLGAGCTLEAEGSIGATGLNLVTGMPADGTPALDAVWDTAAKVGLALASQTPIGPATVLLYARAADPASATFDASTAEWIVLIHTVKL